MFRLFRFLRWIPCWGGWVTERGRPVIQSLLLLCRAAGFIRGHSSCWCISPWDRVLRGVWPFPSCVFRQICTQWTWRKRKHMRNYSHSSIQTLFMFLELKPVLWYIFYTYMQVKHNRPIDTVCVTTPRLFIQPICSVAPASSCLRRMLARYFPLS